MQPYSPQGQWASLQVGTNWGGGLCGPYSAIKNSIPGAPGWHLTLDLSSGPDLKVREFEPHLGLCMDGAEPAWDFVSPSLCPTPARSLSLSLKINK